MFVPFLYELRRRKVPVGTHEAVALAAALARGLHESSLDGFYFVARALLVHSEAHLDAFDQAFALHFRGAAAAGVDLHQQLLDWLREAKARKQLSEEERALLEQFDLEELHRLFEQRLREQTERHDGGNKWIGTGGTSPFGHSGAAREGFRVGGPGGNRSALRVAEQRGFQAYRSDILLDTR
ncbi:MAG: VWA containing CoxE family protein, partial [Deltaproteobacteria bacterium]|nr:VWA containing CoxE family protein [Deltaproteobacteria bacterium]